MPTVFNAANELAVKKFLEEKIGFLDIYEIIAQSMERHKKIAHPDLDEILYCTYDPGSHTKRKFQYLDMVLFCQKKMSQLMDQYHNTENNYSNHKSQFTTCFRSIYKSPPQQPVSRPG